MATTKTYFSLRMHQDVLDKIRIIAERENRSLAMQIEHLCKRYIEKYEKEHGSV